MIYTRMLSFKSKHALLFVSQYGFLVNKRMRDAVANIIEFISKKSDEHCNISALYVDVAKVC